MITLRDLVRAWIAWFALKIAEFRHPLIRCVIKDDVAVLTVKARNGTQLSCSIHHEGELIGMYRALMATKLEHDSRANLQAFQMRLIKGYEVGNVTRQIERKGQGPRKLSS
jgi:hypothetical protein